MVSSFKKAFKELITGKWVLHDGDIIFININILVFTADMLQQATNSGLLSH